MASIDARNNNGRTPLHIAVSMNRGLDIIETFLRAGAATNVTDNEGFTALHLEIQSPNPTIEVIELLFSHNANPDARDNEDLPPLAYVESSNLSPADKKEVARLLIKHSVLMNKYEEISSCESDLEPDEILNFEFCENISTRDEWANFRDICIEEVLNMKNDDISENITLLDIVIDYISKNYELEFDDEQETRNKLLLLMLRREYSVYDGVVINSVMKFLNLH